MSIRLTTILTLTSLLLVGCSAEIKKPTGKKVITPMTKKLIGKTELGNNIYIVSCDIEEDGIIYKYTIAVDRWEEKKEYYIGLCGSSDEL